MYSVKTQELILLSNLAVQRVSQLPGDCQQPGQRPVVQQGAQAQEPLLPVRYVQGWKFMSSSHCQELGQQASWLLIGYTTTNQKLGQQVDTTIDNDYNS